MNDKISKLRELLDEIEKLKQYSADSEVFKKWREKCKFILSVSFGKKSDEYMEFETISFWSMVAVSDIYRNKTLETEAYHTGLTDAKVKLEVMIDKLNYSKSIQEKATDKNTIEKIFISHASIDKEYTDLLVELLHNIGIPKNSNKIFYSSKDGYGIPLGKSIYNYLRDELNKDVMVIFVLSNNYYNSVPCLHEMGATWVNSKKYYTVLLPFFEFKEIKGAIDPMEISFKINDRYKLNEFKNNIIELFNLEKLDDTIWEQDREKFLEKIRILMERDKVKYNSHKEEIKSVRRTRNGDIEVDVMIENLGNKDMICQEMILYLSDIDSNEVSINISDNYLEKLILYSDERKKMIFTLIIEKGINFNPRRYKSGLVESHWSTL